jgi:predicted ribonuclease YlaK
LNESFDLDVDESVGGRRKNMDDMIIDCCLTYKKNGTVPPVALITKDVNLKVKAASRGVRVSSMSEVVQFLNA